MSAKILVTGADGFIGSHLVSDLLKQGFSVRALCIYNSLGTLGWLEGERNNPNLECILGDIRDASFCEMLTKDCDVIFHLAALIAIPYSYIAPQSYVDTNVLGTLNILNAAKKSQPQHVIVTSTSEVYGTARFVPIAEEHPLQAQSPYSASKIGADAIAMSFWHSYEMPVTLARPFNTYGPRQSARAVIPTIISQLSTSKKELHLGDTKPTRDFNFVSDTCRGMISLMQNPDTFGHQFNIGSGREISIGDVFELIRDLMGSRATLHLDKKRVRPQASEVFRLISDNSKIERTTGYQPQVTLEQGLKQTIDWFSDEENLKHYKADIYNR